MLFKTVTLDDVMSTIPMGKETHLPQLPLDGICSQEGTSSVIEPHHQCDPSRFKKKKKYIYIYIYIQHMLFQNMCEDGVVFQNNMI